MTNIVEGAFGKNKPVAVEDRIIIFKRVLNGESYASIAKDFNLSGSRISQIFYKQARILKHSRFMSSDDFDKRPLCRTVEEYRANKEYWLTRIELYKEKIKS